MSSVASLENILLQKVSLELESPNSVLYGENLPGILQALDLPHDIIAKLWSLIQFQQGGRKFSYITAIRPFYCSDTIREITLTQLPDHLARELSPLHFPLLEKIAIEDSLKLTGRGLLSGLSQFQGLRSLTFEKCPQLTWKALASLHPCNELSIIHSLTGNFAASPEEWFPKDTCRSQIYIEGNGPSLDTLVISLRQALQSRGSTCLHALNVSKNSKADDELAFACLNAPGLRKIAFPFGAITMQGLSCLVHLENLEHLDVAHCNIQFSILEPTDSDLWSGFKNLRHLDLSACDFGPEPSRVLTIIHQSCPTLESFTARHSKLDEISRTAMVAMTAKCKVLDLAGNKRLKDNALQLPVFARSTVYKLNIAGTGVSFPLLNLAQWPTLQDLTLDGCELADFYILRLLSHAPVTTTAASDEQIQMKIALPTRLSLRDCKRINDVLLRQVHQRCGGLRSTLEFLDLTNGSCSLREIEKLVENSPFRNSNLSILPVTHGHRADSVVEFEPGTTSDGASSSSSSSVGSRVLRRFVRHVEELDAVPGSENNGSISISDQDRDGDSGGAFSSFSQDEEFEAVKQELLHMCCDCNACVVSHKGAILKRKKRYSKAEMRSIRDAMQLDTHNVA